jgi:hypothetical protein
MEIISPIDGDMLHARDGVTVEAMDCLITGERWLLKPGSEIWVGDKQALCIQNGIFLAQCRFEEAYENSYRRSGMRRRGEANSIVHRLPAEGICGWIPVIHR